jgi:hypothetical protein
MREEKSYYEIKRERKLRDTGNQMRFFFLLFRPGVLQFWLGHHSSMRGKNWGNHLLWLWWVNDFQSFRWYPTLTALCAELYKQIMVKALLKYLLYCRVLTFQCLALSLNSGWCQVKKVGDLHQLCIGKFTRWCCPRNNPALMHGQQDISWMERPGNWPDWGSVLIKSVLCWYVNCCSQIYHR